MARSTDDGSASTEENSSAPIASLQSSGKAVGGVVYAPDPRLQREVALKSCIVDTIAAPGHTERFVAEARAASALNHPNIVTVFDAAFDDDTPYIVSELIDGHTLRHEIGQTPLPVRRILDLATQIADGLAAAHEAGIVHRDLKPENIMLTGSGRVKIVDFGLTQPGGFQLAVNRRTARIHRRRPTSACAPMPSPT